MRLATLQVQLMASIAGADPVEVGALEIPVTATLDRLGSREASATIHIGE